MNKQEALDFAIRDYELNGVDDPKCKFGFNTGSCVYYNYLSKREFEDFLSKMNKTHKSQYDNANGGELEVRESLPPKMASYGSSSRFIYNMSKEIDNFCFEKKLRTRVGIGVANIDGYLCGETDIYIEAKCREIYSSHSKVSVSEKYKAVYDKISHNYNAFSYVNYGANYGTKGTFECSYEINGKLIRLFDIKQLICHFLGITARLLDESNSNKKVKFVYLIFNPKKNTVFTDDRLKCQIINDYDTTIAEIEAFDMKRLFDAVMDFQSETLSKVKPEYSFEFVLTDQSGYAEELK